MTGNFRRLWLYMLPATLTAALIGGIADAKNCGLTDTGRTPLNDLGSETYQGWSGGLYPNGSNTRPPGHLAAGLKIAEERILPRNTDGQADMQGGRIVLISVGMSNTTQEFASKGPEAFKPRADADPAVNPQLVIVDCAQAGGVGVEWADPFSDVWEICLQRLQALGLTVAQVQAAWIKLAERSQDPPDSTFPAHALWHRENLVKTLHLLKEHFPNLAIGYLSSRTRAYENDPQSLNPEPLAYESGFSVKWLIESQIEGDPELNYDPAIGTVKAPWLSWGPYLWTDGLNPRSDGFTWECEDTVNDGIHPSLQGVWKVAGQLLAFFKADPTARSWFLRPQEAGNLKVGAFADETSGAAPLAIQLGVEVEQGSAEDLDFAWTFDDGGTSLSASPSKVFPVPGSYQVAVTASDAAGNASSSVLVVEVDQQSPDSSPARFYFPLIGDGIEFDILFQTRLIFLNSGQSTPVEVSFFDRSGDPLDLSFDGGEETNQLNFNLGPGEVFEAMSSGHGPLRLGYAVVRGGAHIEGTAIFVRSQPSLGIPLYTLAVPASHPVSEFTLFADTSGFRNTGLALVNPVNDNGIPVSAEVELRFYDRSFRLLALRNLEIEGGNAVSQFARGEFFPDLGEEVGTIVGRSNRPLAVLGLLQNDSGAPFPIGVPNLSSVPLLGRIPDVD